MKKNLKKKCVYVYVCVYIYIYIPHTHTYLIHFAVHLKLMQHCKLTKLQSKNVLCLVVLLCPTL